MTKELRRMFVSGSADATGANLQHEECRLSDTPGLQPWCDRSVALVRNGPRFKPAPDAQAAPKPPRFQVCLGSQRIACACSKLSARVRSRRSGHGWDSGQLLDGGVDPRL